MSIQKDLDLCFSQFLCIQEGLIKASFCPSAQASFFHGHFPGNPIVPAVIQLEWARVLVQKGLFPAYRIQKIKKAKFHHPIEVDQKVEITLHLEAKGDLLFVKANLISHSQKISTFSLVFQKENKEREKERI